MTAYAPYVKDKLFARKSRTGRAAKIEKLALSPQRKCTKEGALTQNLDTGNPSAKMHDVAMT